MFRWGAPGTFAVDAPRGFGRAAEVALQSPPARVRTGDMISLRVRLSAPARVTTSTTGPGPDRSTVVVRDRGRTRLEWRAPERPGEYRIVVRAIGAATADVSRALAVTVVGEPSVPEAGGGRSLWETIILGVAAAALVAAVAVGVASFAATTSRRDSP
jgi:hypothetical protein